MADAKKFNLAAGFQCTFFALNLEFLPVNLCHLGAQQWAANYFKNIGYSNDVSNEKVVIYAIFVIILLCGQAFIQERFLVRQVL